MDGVKVFGLLTVAIPLFVIVTRCYYSKQQQPFEEEEEEQEEEQEQEHEQVEAAASLYWAQLDQNLLGEIHGRLSLIDQARFRSVCTNWLVASNSHSNSALKTKSLPWHGCRYPSRPEIQIYDPLSSPNHLASQQIITCSHFGIQSPDYVNLLSMKYHCFMHNWLFIGIRKSRSFFWNRRFVLLFSPLTKRIITLPKFDYPKRFEFNSTFSTHPDSQDCVFCLVNAFQVVKFHVLTYRYGDKEWTATQFNRHPHFYSCDCTLHIISGILYILSPRNGQVASYNILNGEFNFDCLLGDQFVVQNGFGREIRSFVLNGELMILCFNGDVEKAIPGQQFIRRYDRLSKVWIPVTTLADYALFFGTSFINVLLINTKDDMTCNGVLPNKIYHFFKGGCLVYSLEDGRLVQFKSINSNLLEDGGDNLPEYKYNYAFPETLNAFWLEAPRVCSSSDNQEVRSFRDEGKQGTIRALG